MPRPKRLAIAVSFHFVENRLAYLRAIAKHFNSLGDEVLTFIVTNSNSPENAEKISVALDGTGVEYRLIVPHLLGHPYLLTWTHFEVFRYLMQNDSAVTHFLYLEDDICVKPHNMAYWLRGREKLRQFGLYPSFVRFERREIDGPPYSSDALGSADPGQLPRVVVNDDYVYVNLPWPYQGMYLLDRELMAEHLGGPSSSPDSGIWFIREKAAQGLTFAKVPKGFLTRNVVGYRIDKGGIDENSLIHHTPNNYVDKPDTELGKTLVRDMLKPPLTIAVAARGLPPRVKA